MFEAIVEKFRQSVVKLSLKMHGCRVIQKAVALNYDGITTFKCCCFFMCSFLADVEGSSGFQVFQKTIRHSKCVHQNSKPCWRASWSMEFLQGTQMHSAWKIDVHRARFFPVSTCWVLSVWYKMLCARLFDAVYLPLLPCLGVVCQGLHQEYAWQSCCPRSQVSSFHTVHNILQSVSKDAKTEVQKCIEQMPPESVSFVVEAVEARLETVKHPLNNCVQLFSNELSVFETPGMCWELKHVTKSGRGKSNKRNFHRRFFHFPHTRKICEQKLWQDKAEAMAAHIYGCRIIQRLLEQGFPELIFRDRCGSEMIRGTWNGFKLIFDDSMIVDCGNLQGIALLSAWRGCCVRFFAATSPASLCTLHVKNHTPCFRKVKRKSRTNNTSNKQKICTPVTCNFKWGIRKLSTDPYGNYVAGSAQKFEIMIRCHPIRAKPLRSSGTS